MESAPSSADAEASRLSSFQTTAIARRGALGMRLGLGLFGVLVLAILSSPAAAGVWFGAVLACQLFSSFAFDRFSVLDDRRPPTRLERLFCQTALLLVGVSYSSLTVPLWLDGGVAGMVFSVIWLCGALVHVALHTQHDPQMLKTTVTPHLLFFIGLPAYEFWLGTKLEFVGAGVILTGSMLYTLHLVLALQRNKQVSAVLRATQKRALERQAAAEAASESKSRFLAVMSHELRTPMNGVLGMTRLLLESELSQRQRQQAESLQDAGDMLLSILNDILDFSKIEAGAIKLAPGDVDLHRLAASLVALWRDRAEERGLKLEAIVSPDAPAVVVADGQRLRQVISNLLSNAVKFTDKGEVRLEIDAVRLGDEQARLRIAVVDTGCGVPPENADRLFDAFEQADGSATRQFGGAGLGLAIARRLSRLMGGDISLLSEVGVGSRFTFEAELPVADWTAHSPVIDLDAPEAHEPVLESDDPEIEFEDVTGFEPIDAAEDLRDDTVVLDADEEQHDGPRDELLYSRPEKPPLAWRAPGSRPEVPAIAPVAAKVAAPVATVAPAKPKAAAIPAPAPASAAKRLQVCVVEDQALNRRVIEAALHRLACDLTFAVDGGEALERLAAQKFDLVFMDLQMPVHDGFEVTRRLRAEGGVNARTPVVGLTANVLHGVRESCLAAGMDDFIAKPLDLKLLYQVIERVLTGRGEAAAEKKRA